jgi:hypothetical protein
MLAFLGRFFRRSRVASGAVKPNAVKEFPLPSSGIFHLEVVGESHYQDALERICGGRTEQGADLRCVAALVLDDTNPYDRNAVRVEINGLQVGHLDREDAKEYRKYLRQHGLRGIRGTCKARIRGGWRRGDETGHFGVYLDFSLY